MKYFDIVIKYLFHFENALKRKTFAETFCYFFIV